MKTVLLYNIYLINNWRSCTEELLALVPQDDIFVNLSFDLRCIYKLPAVVMYLKRRYPKLKRILLTHNNAQLGETPGFEKLRKYVDLDRYDIATYIHSKGVSRPENPHEGDWRELMRYFVMERFDLMIEAFRKGYYLYGANLCKYEGRDEDRNYAQKHSDFWYRGTFVSVNLKAIGEKFRNVELGMDNFAVEGFFGKLCDYEKAYSPHNSGVSHYNEPYPEKRYKEIYPRQNHTKELSIIILNYNAFDLTKKCIKSVIDHTENVDKEIILVDNGSKECDPDLFKQTFPEIELVKSPENLGFARGNNLGVERTTGEYILLLNNDTEIRDDSIKLCLEKIKSDKSIGALSASMVFENGEMQHIANRFPSIKLELIELFRIHKVLSAETRGKLLLGFFFDHKSEIEADWIWGTFFMIRKDIIARMSGRRLRDDFFVYFEDVVWCYDIKKMGCRILYYPCGEVVHHLSQTRAYDSDLKKFEGISANEYSFLREQRTFLYLVALYLVRCVKFLTLRGLQNKKIAWFYLKSIFITPKAKGSS